MTILNIFDFLNTILNMVGVLVAICAAMATFQMLVITRKQISPKLSSMSIALELIKKEQIYEKYFNKKQMNDTEFERAVKKAYSKIELLLPNLDDKGKSDEDWYLGEWLYDERSDYECIKGKEKKDVAYLIYSIRKNI